MIIKILSCESPKWTGAKHDEILCSVTVNHLPGKHPFHARADDPEPHGRDLFARLLAGEFGPIAEAQPVFNARDIGDPLARVIASRPDDLAALKDG